MSCTFLVRYITLLLLLSHEDLSMAQTPEPTGEPESSAEPEASVEPEVEPENEVTAEAEVNVVTDYPIR